MYNLPGLFQVCLLTWVHCPYLFHRFFLLCYVPRHNPFRIQVSNSKLNASYQVVGRSFHSLDYLMACPIFFPAQLVNRPSLHRSNYILFLVRNSFSISDPGYPISSLENHWYVIKPFLLLSFYINCHFSDRRSYHANVYGVCICRLDYRDTLEAVYPNQSSLLQQVSSLILKTRPSHTL